MTRLPPNGPGWLPKTYPPLEDDACPSGGDDKDPSCTYQSLNAFNSDCSSMTSQDNANCPIVGCGDDPVSAGWAGSDKTIGWLKGELRPPK